MSAYRKKPIVIEAVQFTEAMARREVPSPRGVNFFRNSIGPPPECKLLAYDFNVNTLEGDMHVSIGDWIITGVKGEVYPCKPDIFAATYDPVVAVETPTK